MRLTEHDDPWTFDLANLRLLANKTKRRGVKLTVGNVAIGKRMAFDWKTLRLKLSGKAEEDLSPREVVIVTAYIVEESGVELITSPVIKGKKGKKQGSE